MSDWKPEVGVKCLFNLVHSKEEVEVIAVDGEYAWVRRVGKGIPSTALLSRLEPLPQKTYTFTEEGLSKMIHSWDVAAVYGRESWINQNIHKYAEEE